MPAKKPTDHLPPAPAAGGGGDLFTWVGPGGVTVTLLAADLIPFGVFEDAAALPDMQGMFVILRAACPDDDTRDALRGLPIRYANQLFEAWTRGVGVGESGRSST